MQRVIAAHDGVATTSEPWLLLPLIYALREEGARAEYGHKAAAQAISDFCGELPDGTATYTRGVADMARGLYAAAAGPDASWFVDKTPRYHFVASELLELFPEAKFIFLWRNPLAVVASLLNTFRAGRWEPLLFRNDLFDGVGSLLDARAQAGERAFEVRYEDLVSGPSRWAGLFDYLGIRFDEAALENHDRVPLRGRYGDPGGGAPGLSANSVDLWRGTMSNRVRKRWCRDYLRWIGTERLATMGYRLDDLIAALDEAPERRRWKAPIDLARHKAAGRTSSRWRQNLEALDSPLPIYAP